MKLAGKTFNDTSDARAKKRNYFQNNPIYIYIYHENDKSVE